METLTKQEFRKKLQRKVIVGRILTFIILVGLAWSHFHSLDDQQEGVMVGILLGLALMTIRYNLALRREENFEKLYIQVTDERNRTSMTVPNTSQRKIRFHTVKNMESPYPSMKKRIRSCSMPSWEPVSPM